jgi:hypothetical protein
LAELLDLADAETLQQRDQLALVEERYIDLLADHEMTLAEAAELRSSVMQLQADLHRAQDVLRRNDLDHAYWEGAATAAAAPAVPAHASSPSEAFMLAQLYLSEYVDLPDGAARDLHDLDAAVEASAWGQTSWEGFRALHAYAQTLADGRSAGSFWTWCEKSAHPLAWRATSKKLAMGESKTVKDRAELRAKRVLPVSRELDGTGRCFMEAHLKIAEGGGPLAPRIYFIPSPKTGKVHVGFFGPHRHMPNTMT